MPDINLDEFKTKTPINLDEFKGQKQQAPAPTGNSIPPVQGSAPERFGKSLYGASPLPAIGALADPETFGEKISHGLVDPQMDEFRKAKAAMSDPQGGSTLMRASTAFGHGLAGMVPVVGPMAAHLGEQLGSGDIAGAAGTGTGLALPSVLGHGVPKAVDAVPRTARASANFDKVMATARNEPVDLTKVQPFVDRAQQLSDTGGPGVPKPMRKFIEAPPSNYETGRDFASNAGNLSVKQSMKINRPMGAQMKGFANALDEANGQAANNAGVGKEYNDAMTEYRRAQQLKSAGRAALKYGIPTALGTGVVAGLARKATE